MLCCCDTDPQAGWALGGQISNEKNKNRLPVISFSFSLSSQGLGREHTQIKINSDHCQSICLLFCIVFMGWYLKQKGGKGTKSVMGIRFRFCFFVLLIWPPGVQSVWRSGILNSPLATPSDLNVICVWLIKASMYRYIHRCPPYIHKYWGDLYVARYLHSAETRYQQIDAHFSYTFASLCHGSLISLRGSAIKPLSP